MIAPQDILDRLKELVQEKFPGEPVYMDKVPDSFDRPSNLIALGKCSGNAEMAPGIVELTPVITLTTFATVDAYHNSHMRELNNRQMILTGILLPGYIKVKDRAPKVKGLALESGYDFASVTVTFSVTLDRDDFMELEQAPMAEHLSIHYTEK